MVVLFTVSSGRRREEGEEDEVPAEQKFIIRRFVVGMGLSWESTKEGRNDARGRTVFGRCRRYGRLSGGEDG